MVRLSVIALFLCVVSARSQSITTVYAATPEGLPNKKQYILFEYANFFVCDSCKLDFKNDTMFEKFKAITFYEHRIIINLNMMHNGKLNPAGAKMIFGFLTEDKKIVFGKAEAVGQELQVYEPSPEETKEAPYIFNKKVYDHNGNIIAIIEGEEKYGAAWYLLTFKK